MDLSKYKTLGVINLTPNSFSDHGASLDPRFFHTQLKSFLEDPSVIVDIGFESTAPMNSAISESEELNRFESFLLASKNYSFEQRPISFDTYKVKNFLLMAHEFQLIHPLASIIFNDVSGVLDENLKDALMQFRGKNFYYIYNSTHIPDREYVLQHMKYTQAETDILEVTSTAFKKAHVWFKSFQMETQLILDPGFGFSKTFEQNWQLINHFEKLDSMVDKEVPMLIGLSKKSFLKKALEENHRPQSLIELEELHKKCMRDIQLASVRKLLFRVHDPKIMINI